MSDLLAGTGESQSIFCKSIKERGYALIKVDKASTREALKEYNDALELYFTKPLDEKKKNSDPDNNNLGYIKGDDREYLKVCPYLFTLTNQLRPFDTENFWPTEVPGGDTFKRAYDKMFSEYSQFAFKAFELLSTYVDEGADKPLIDPGNSLSDPCLRCRGLFSNRRVSSFQNEHIGHPVLQTN